MDSAELANRFKFHPATTPERQQDHEAVRKQCAILGGFLDATVPDGREKAIVFTKLEEVMFWAVATLARGSDN
ncbi:hypothetical protein AB0942_33215 [Streptomyces nodosus]|uniref:Acb2/Tad1 domain-containing protein n=1 Tax=Streptomyces nodosus TaxID=40318 RepID=UPI0034563160